jgi:uncharacterized protein (TIGR02246 family)
MRRIIQLTSLVLLLIASIAAHAQDASTKAIEHVLYAQQAAWNAGDIETFMHGYQDSPETTFIGKTIASGYQGILERYRKTYANHDAMGKLDFSGLKVRMLGENHAVVTGRFHLTRTAAGGGNASGVYSLVFEKGAKGWQIILDHTSAD